MSTVRTLLRWLKRIALTILALVITATLALTAYYFYARPSVDLRAAYRLREQVMFARHSADKHVDFAATFSEAKKIADEYPNSAGALVALQAAVSCAKEPADIQLATAEYQQHLRKSDFSDLAKSIEVGIPPWTTLSSVSPQLLKRVNENTSRPEAGVVASTICLIERPTVGSAVSPTYRDAANLIRGKLAAQTGIQHFAESLCRTPVNCETWTYEFEPHLREILKVNQDPFVRCSTMFALAMIIKDQPTRYDEAKQLLADFCNQYDGTKPSTFQIIEQNYAFYAKAFLEEMRHQSLGMMAVETNGIDLDDKPIDLQEYRGKVVLLSFWATWCGPCIKLIPHERQLQSEFGDRPFTVLGVNVDTDRNAARQSVSEHGITWRSFVSTTDGHDSISSRWNVIAYPTVYLLDHRGIIRKRWIDAPPASELHQNIDVLVQAAQASTTPEAMNAVAKQLQSHAIATTTEPIDDHLTQEIHKCLVDKQYVDSAGVSHPYVIYQSPQSDRSTNARGILFLHGSGARGNTCDHATANCLPLLANIHRNAPTAPVLVVIPLAHEAETWLADGSGGQRAIAIMDRVQQEYSALPNRWIITGFSMGGEGTWSLAAAHPNRFAAIVPISHGGPNDSISKLLNTPCWCFHGDADAMIPVAQSRAMIEALTQSGAHPRYSELPSVGHEDAAKIAYSDQELLTWMLDQSKP